jgi:hypothetical protein
MEEGVYDTEQPERLEHMEEQETETMRGIAKSDIPF